MLLTTLTAMALGATATTMPAQSDTLHFTHVAAGGRNTCAIALRGVAYCWGANDQGQLGDGDRRTGPAKRLRHRGAAATPATGNDDRLAVQFQGLEHVLLLSRAVS